METKPDGLKIISLKSFSDERGYFLETYRKDFLDFQGIYDEFVQDNISFSKKGVLRGLHFQTYPFRQSKLITVLRGKILDVVVDLRSCSDTYGQHFKIELSSDTPTLFYIPEGFAHGFSVLSETCLFQYKCSNYYNQKSECGILWNDPELAIDWQVENPIVSEKDSQLPLFKNLQK